MDKIVVGLETPDMVTLSANVADNLNAIAKAKESQIRELTVIPVDRPRNAALIEAIEKQK